MSHKRHNLFDLSDTFARTDPVKVHSAEFFTAQRATKENWEGYYESRICSRDTYPESCITKYTS